jgi:phosphoribosylamine--glycine ligase
VPAPRWAKVTTVEALEAALSDWEGVPVVKADGLASGKGVFLPDTIEECLEAGKALLAGSLGDAGKTVVLEERLFGIEASLFYACNGTKAVSLPHARDHKRLQDGDAGPNTGGMGAISPNPVITEAIQDQVFRECVLPTLEALEKSDAPFRGFLFGGFMLTENGPKLLEYNVRLGDPEAQAILPRLPDGAFLELCVRTASGDLDDFELTFKGNATCAIVLAAAGYPASPRKGDEIHVQSRFATEGRWLIHAGTRSEDGRLVTAGGRVAAVVATESSPELARSEAYGGLDQVSFDGVQFRQDIGEVKTLGEER